jgi:amino acid adenylation domain-containing protein/non-ribosomal peptide synthase protein (TIGR01720 family)
MDRKTVSTWVESVITVEQCQQIIMGHNPAESTTKTSTEDSQKVPLTDVEAKLLKIWSVVLNLPADQINLDDRSFLSLGGDSISAMACASQAKKASLGLTVQNVLRAKSLRQLASVAKQMAPQAQDGDGIEDEEELDIPYNLSPIQQLHFQVRGEAHGDEHFNQSFCLRLARYVDAADVREALEIVVKRHPMLRTRFKPSGPGGQWQQFITANVEASFRFRTRVVRSLSEADADIASAHGCMDVLQGPIFAAELFAVKENGHQILFMTAHHLVIDLVSWRVILDEMEDLLEQPSGTKKMLAAHRTLSFHKWTALQIEDCKGKSLNQVLPAAEQVPAAQFDYWGMHNQLNLYGEVACQGFELGTTTTEALTSQCHTPLRTETVDLLLAALIWSFHTTFQDRTPPAIFNEGHGREPPVGRDDVDISRTIGWFTTLFPVALASPASFVEALIQTKDIRRRVPGNGRPYFATRVHTDEGRARWGAHHKDMEVTFNFLGRYQQLERAGALFQPAAGALMAGEAHPGSPTADFGSAARRFALFEISAVIVRGALRFSFAWNRGMEHQTEIREWISACSNLLEEAAATLPRLGRKITASDFVLLPDLTPTDLDAFERSKLPALTDGRGWEAIEDMYPNSPIQQGLLMSRSKDGSFYAVRRAFRVMSSRGEQEAVDTARLIQSWKRVVQHHALLRTVFVEAISQTRAGSYDQVVLKEVEPLVLERKCPGGEDEMRRMIEDLEPMQYHNDKPQHRLSVFYNGKTIFCVLEMSHAVMDGASMDILLRDLARSYDGSLERLPKPLFSPFMQHLQQRSAEADIAFWTHHLEGMEPCHFPVLNDGVMVSETDRELRSLRIPFSGLAALRSFCDNTGVTLPNAFHAAWALTLACYTGTDDVCFGFLVSGRDGAVVEGSEEAIGPFINMATQRVRLGSEDGQLSLLHVLEAVQRDQLDCMPYTQASLAEVQHALNLPGGMALFNTCISYRRRLPSQQSQNGAVNEPLVFEDVGAIHDPTEYPISLNIEVDEERGAAIDVDYWTDAVASTQAEHVANTFLQALLNITVHAEMPISQLDQVHETTKEQIWAWNANMPPLTPECIHHKVEEQVRLRPQAQAIRGWDGDFSYKEMDAAANRLAQHLFDFGVGPEVLVPVCFDKSAWTTIAMLAVLKAGGGVVPLNAADPVDALEGKVADAGTHVVVASESRAPMFESMVPYVVAIGPGLLSQLSATATDEPEILSGVSPEDPAFVMFTSGSTGKPKGVVLCHQALVSSAYAHGSALGLGPHTRFLQFAAHTFDNSLEEMFTTLLHGGCVCVPSDADRLGNLAGAIDALDANFMDLTPTVAALLRPEQVPKIRGMAVGGEALTQEVLEIWADAIPVHNQYGPSECSINATHRLHTDSRGDVANIGTSVGSVSWVVDPRDHDRLVPVGCVGEILIEGPILARGYLNKPVETAKAFIEIPNWAVFDPRHAERGDRRMYKTGDLVRYNSDGSMIYLGRKDTQVKLHGQRIELGEIEHHVKAHLPPAAQSSVELLSIGQGQKVLAVFICLASEEKDVRILPMDSSFGSLSQTIAGEMATQVASYMVPGLFLPVSNMPLTSSGKLDRRRLRGMAQALAGANGNGVVEYRLGARARNGRAPETPMEKNLQDLWATVLKVPAEVITADDSFFRHGGDSVMAMRLVAAARQKGISLTVASIFQTLKLSDMAKVAVGSLGPNGEVSADANIVIANEEEPLPGPAEPFSLLKVKKTMDMQGLLKQVASICRVDLGSIEDIYPCTQLQAGLVAASQRQPGAYVAVNSYELPAGTDIVRFKKAWQEVVDSEAILRTRVVFLDRLGFLQVVVRDKIAWTSATSLDDLPETDRHLPPQDGGILSRYTIIGENSSRPTFTWTAHHALYDGWSLPTLLRRVEERYRRPEAPLVPTPHYSRFVEYLSSVDISASDAYWTAEMSTDGSTAPQQFPQLPHPGYRVQATSQTSHSVRFTRAKGVELTMASFLRAAWALVVSIYSSSDDIVFGEVLSGRDVPLAGVEDLVGPTLATLPRRIRIDRSMSVEKMLANVQSQLNGAIPHQFAGLQRIKTLSPDAGAACEFQNLLVIDAADDVAEDSLWSNLTSGGTKQSADFFSYPLNVTCTVSRSDNSDEVEVRAYFDAEVIPQWQITRMLGLFETVLQRVSAVENQQESIGDMDMLSQDDKAAVSEWNRIPVPLVERRIHDVIGEQMTSQGSSATAVIGWDATLTHGELDALSTIMARKLSSKGVGSNSSGGEFVPFCLEKSAFAVVAMLAILKAGAAFVPLDPAHPVGRLREIVADCSASVILCSPKHEGLCSQIAATVVPADMALLRKMAAESHDSSPRMTSAATQGVLNCFLFKIPIEIQILWKILTKIQQDGACQPSDTAYVIFTSGTTGKPKGTIGTYIRSTLTSLHLARLSLLA